LNETEKTPGRRARATSAWGRSDLARRVARLPIPEESRARVGRFVEDEIERAKAAWMRETVPLAGLECPKCQKPIEGDLRKKAVEAEVMAALERVGALDLPADELERLMKEARGARAGS
jgi:hypothetical protein